MNRWMVFAAAVFLSACGSTQTQQVADADKPVCTREVAVGTTIATTRCRTRAEIAYEREAARDAVNTIRPSAPAPAGIKP